MKKINHLLYNNFLILMLLISFIYLFYFHFIFHNLQRHIFSHPEVEEIIIFFSLIINDGHVEAYDHTGYPLFIFLSFLFKILKILNIIEISNLADLIKFDLYSESYKKIFIVLRIFSFFINFFCFVIILNVLRKSRLDISISFFLIIFLLLIPNLNYLFIGSTTSGIGLLFLLLSINYFYNHSSKFNIFYGTLFLSLAIQTKIQFLPFAFLIPIFFLIKVYFIKEKVNNTSRPNVIFYLSLIFFIFILIFILLLLLKKGIFSEFHVFIIFFYFILTLLFLYLKKNNRQFFSSSIQIYLAFSLSIIFLTIKFHPNNFFVIFDPLNTNKGFFESPLITFSANIKNLFLFVWNKFYLLITSPLNYNVKNFPFSNNVPISQPIYFFHIIFLFISLIKFNRKLFIINAISLIFVLIIIKINDGVRDWPNHFWYLIYTDIISFIIIIINFNILFHRTNLLNILKLLLISIIIINNINFYKRYKAISSYYEFIGNHSNAHYVYEHCARLPYFNRSQKTYSLLRLTSFDNEEITELKNKFLQKFFYMCDN